MHTTSLRLSALDAHLLLIGYTKHSKALFYWLWGDKHIIALWLSILFMSAITIFMKNRNSPLDVANASHGPKETNRFVNANEWASLKLHLSCLSTKVFFFPLEYSK